VARVETDDEAAAVGPGRGPDGTGPSTPRRRVTSVAVCALTFQRPRALDALLTSLATLDDPGADHRVTVIVVDNDPDQSARAVVERRRADVPWELVYVPEPRRGISFGRNTAVRTAGDADFVAFIDDDETAEPAWLAELLRVQRLTGADVVTGAVLAAFEAEPPRWVADGRFFERQRFATGHPMTYARTGNVLIARRVFPAGDPAPFNEAMAVTGGEDTHFFLRAHLQGCSIVWADDAVTHEAVPTSRVGVRWLLRREYRRGNTLSLCLRDLEDSPWRRFRRTGLGVLNVGRGAVAATIGVVRGRAALVAGLQRACFGAGLLVGLTGRRYVEYRTVHGS
jgi:succinoglycan biosynthesis protein ExoM